jgi:ankyrin repeat protein
MAEDDAVKALLGRPQVLVHLAVARGDLDAVSSLLREGHPFERFNEDGRNALHLAVAAAAPPLVAALLEGRAVYSRTF